MQVLVVKGGGTVVAEECCIYNYGSGFILTTQPYILASYLHSQGFAVAAVDTAYLPPEASLPFSQFQAVVLIVPLLSGAMEATLPLVRQAKEAGCITIAVLNDYYEGTSEELLEQELPLDYAVGMFEREISVGGLLKELKEGKEIPSTPGIYYRTPVSLPLQKGKVSFTGVMPHRRDLSHLPSSVPIWKTVPRIHCLQVWILTGRGCPYRCTFCNYRGTGARKRPVPILIEELRYLYERNILQTTHETYFFDLDLLLNKPWAKQLCHALINSGMKFQWSTNYRVTHCFDDEMLTLLRRAGCTCLAMGIESLDNEILMRTHKGFRSEDVSKAVKNILKHGIEPRLNFMIGFPWDNEKTLGKVVSFLEEFPFLNGKNAQTIVPLPGTPLYDEFQSLGLLSEKISFRKYAQMNQDIVSGKAICPTLHLEKNEITSWWEKATVAFEEGKGTLPHPALRHLMKG